MNRLFTAAALCASLALIPACHHHGGHGGVHQTHGDVHQLASAICNLSATEGNNVAGSVTFTQTEAGLRVQADVTGLTPGKHGFHVHMYGDISAANGTATGGHYNPDGMDHGLPGMHDDDHMVGGHAGDLGNLDADASGHATYDVTYKDLKLIAILGRGIIVHRDEDNGGQPTGNAGPRIAQGVIGIAAGE